ncbi:MAG: flagellar basal body-associated FliL family protein [Rhodospirillaceae bacterium]|nr:flagellar basal body-associated FliL family protein [Rhodospirillaceae bacterium]
MARARLTAWICSAALTLGATAPLHAQTAGEPPVFVDLPQIISNLDTDERRQRFILLNLSLELANAEDTQVIEHEMPRIQDVLQTYLRDLTVEDLEGSAGSYELREALLHRVRLAVPPVEVGGLLFREVLIQ